MSQVSFQLGRSQIPKLVLADPRWETLLREAKARFGITSLRPEQHPWRSSATVVGASPSPV